jgi:hypothetical protein
MNHVGGSGGPGQDGEGVVEPPLAAPVVLVVRLGGDAPDHLVEVVVAGDKELSFTQVGADRGVWLASGPGSVRGL